MIKAQVVFATITGNNEDVADIITEALEDLQVTVTESEISQTDVSSLTDKDIVVIVPYTYDEGALPEEGLDFFDDLADTDLSRQVYGVAGSGDIFYGDDYGVAVDRFDTQLAKSGAKKGTESLKINLSPDENDIQKLDQFADNLVSTVSN